MSDIRDLRDPEKLGEEMIAHMKHHKGFGLRMTDEWPIDHALPIVPNVPKHESMGTQTAAAFRRELEERTDRFAKAALRDIDAGKGVQGYDDAGT
jgi:hypothetical protein